MAGHINLLIMESYELLARIKHEAGTKLLSISSSLRNIENTLNKTECQKLFVSEKHNITIQDTINLAMSTLNELHKIFNKYENNV